MAIRKEAKIAPTTRKLAENKNKSKGEKNLDKYVIRRKKIQKKGFKKLL